MAMNLVQAEKLLQRYIDAELEVLDGRTVTFGGRTLTLVDLAEIRAGRQEWERKVNSLKNAARGCRRPYKLADFL